MKRYNPCSTGVTLAAVPLQDGDIAITAATTNKKRKSGGASVPASRVTVITLTINTERDLVELRFPGKPDDATRAEMKAAKFRWYGPAGCWYHKHTPDNRQWAEDFIARQGRTQPVAHQSSHDAGVPITPAVDPLIELFSNTAVEFQASIGRISVVAGKPPIEVYALWRKYSDDCQSGDQSALLSEFIEWYKPSLGGDLAALRDALEPAQSIQVVATPPVTFPVAVTPSHPKIQPSNHPGRPTCVFCGRSGNGVQFAIFSPRFKPFGTACTDCEATLPPGTELPSAEKCESAHIVESSDLAILPTLRNCASEQTEPKCLTAGEPPVANGGASVPASRVPAWRQRLARQ